MECLKCESGTVLDRLVVDRVTEQPMGALCDSCQRTDIERVFRGDVWHEDSGCVICADRAHYYLPEIELRIEFDDHREDSIEYSVTDTTARLCSDHFEELLRGEAAGPMTSTGAVTQ